MIDWLSRSAGDFLMFGPDVYWRLFELHNRALWPLPVFAAIIGLGVLVLMMMRSPAAVRIVWIATALAWAGAAHFLAARYAPINWPVGYAVWAFVAQAVLTALAAASGGLVHPAKATKTPTLVGWGLLAYAVVLHPLVGLVFGRPLAQAEVFGIAPDPTALASLGLLSLMASGRWTIILAILPVLWCAFSAATLATLGAPQGWILFAALGLWAASRIAGAVRTV